MFDDWSVHPEWAYYSNVYTIGQNPKFRCRSKKDICSTYDGYTIVSTKFKDFCQDQGYLGLEFVPFALAPGRFWLKVNNIVAYDGEARKTQFSYYNEEFKSYKEVIGATPVYLQNKVAEIGDGIFRTDIFFGENFKKCPLLLCGRETKIKMKKIGIIPFFEKILDYYPPPKFRPGDRIVGINF
jgi:hypothetical protein